MSKYHFNRHHGRHGDGNRFEPSKPKRARFSSSKEGLSCLISQNFLTSRALIERLMRLTSLGKEDLVLEIGPGKGHTTQALLERCGRVLAVEKDPVLAGRLQDRFAGSGRLELVCGDFLHTALPHQPYKVFSNLPFCITTASIEKLVWANHPPQDAWLIVEKGAGKRFCGKPAQTLQSLLLRPFYRLQWICDIGRENFHPMPSVDAIFLHISTRAKPDLPMEQRESYRRFILHFWKNGLFSSEALLTKKQISTALRLAGLPQIERSGDVLYVQWLCLFRCYLQYGKKK